MSEPYFSPDTLDADGCPTWLNVLAGEESDPNHLVHAVRDLGPADALEMLGVDPAEIRPAELPARPPGDLTSLARAAIHPLNPTVVLIAGRVGDWTFIYDDLGETGWQWPVKGQSPCNTTEGLSRAGKIAVTSGIAITGQAYLTYAADGTILLLSGDPVFRAADLGEDAPADLRAAVDAAGTFGAEVDFGLGMRTICALAGLPRTLDQLRQLPLLLAALD